MLCFIDTDAQKKNVWSLSLLCVCVCVFCTENEQQTELNAGED